MNKQAILTLSTTLALAAGAAAQNPGHLVTYAQPEGTLSGSGGTVLAQLLPNEISYFETTSVTCPTASAEKWLPRTASHVMAGDENSDGIYFNPGIFGSIDALLAPQNAAGAANVNQRTAFWSVSNAMGNAISAQPFRPGDVARIVRNVGGEGQVEYFMRQEAFVQALGMPAGSNIDIDAIAFGGPNIGVFFSLDVDTLGIIDCGPTLIRDGDVLCVPGSALAYTADLRIAGAAPNSVIVAHTEAQMDALITNAQVTDRFGNCIDMVIDVESLEIDWSGPQTTVVSCSGITIQVPTFVYSAETGTGASLVTTQFGGQIYNTLCGPAGTSCGSGPTLGDQMGIRPTTPFLGAPSWINGLSFTRVCRTVLEPQQHVMNVFPVGSPAGATQIDYASQFPFNVALIQIVPPVVPTSILALPWSMFCFPDLYATSITVHAWPLPGPFGSFPMVAIPPAWTGKVLFQNVGWGSTLELSTPAVIDVQ